MTSQVNSIRIKNLIAGEWVEETDVDYVPLYNPSTGAQIGEVPLSNPDTSLNAVESAYAAYDSWRNLSVNKRVSYLYDIRRAMIDKEEDLAVAIAVDQAKHVSEARGEVQRVVQIIETACSIPTLIQGESLDHIAGNINGRVIKSPLGVFCGVAPCNFPALVFGWFIPFAIGVGLIRDQEFGNGACIFTQNLYYTEKFINQADVGMVGVNVGIPAPHPYLPFGGIKDSHLGTDKVQGKDGIDFFTQNKIATIRFAPPTGRFTDESGKEMKDATASKGVRSCVAQ